MTTPAVPTRAWIPSTARWIAAVRERETARGDRLFDDPFAQRFAGTAGWEMLKRSEGTGGENKYIPVRVRYFDDLVVEFARDVDQLVLLGAGYDSRAMRLGLPRNLHVFELDAGTLIDEKEQSLPHAAASCRLSRVATDFSSRWIHHLLAAGFKQEARTLWLAEGVFFYLSPEQVEELLAVTYANCGPGSAFAADISGAGMLELPQMAAYLTWLRSSHQPDPFTTSDPVALFARAGWDAARVVQAGQPQANYGRMVALPEQSPLLPAATFLVTATKMAV